MNTKKNVLFAGCSHTAGSGFSKENEKLFNWPNLLSKHYGFNVENIAFGGMSNEEIYFRVLENIIHPNKFDLVIVMWSSLDRKWVYPSSNNIDNFTIINKPIPQGTQHTEWYAKKYAELYHKYFNNHYIHTKRFLLMMQSLGKVLDQMSVPYVFANAFDHQFKNLSEAKFNDGWENLTSFHKDMLNFDNEPDHRIEQKLFELQNIVNCIDKKKFIEFETFSFMYSCASDLADDGAHLGPKSNQLLANKIISHIDQWQLLK